MYEGMCPGMFDLGIFNCTSWATEVLRDSGKKFFRLEKNN